MVIVRDEAGDLSRAISRTAKAQRPRAIRQGHRATPRQDAPSKPGRHHCAAQYGNRCS